VPEPPDRRKKLARFTDAMALFGAAPASPRDEPRGAGGESSPLSVTEFTGRMRDALEALGTHRVAGEVSNFAEKGGHWYFTLKDDEASLPCVMWREQVRSVSFPMQDGVSVVATGSPSFYGKFGKAQLYVRKLEEKGLGSLEARLKALIEELRGLGYLEEVRKRPLPVFPTALAVVTSRESAAEADVIRTARMRFPGLRLVLVDVRVQGDQAAPQVARAIGALDRNAARLGIDAILVTRGGGSLEDLWAFNERIVADAAFRRRNVPIVAAIGHETDTTVLCLVADRRASTPTQAVAILVPDAESLRERLDSIAGRLRQAGRAAVRTRRERLARLERHPYLRRPGGAIEAARERLGRAAAELSRSVARRLERDRRDVLAAAARWKSIRPEARLAAASERVGRDGTRLETAARRRLAEARARLAALERQLVAVGPDSVLARGFSYTEREDGSLVRSASDATPGLRVRTTVADGSFVSEVVGGKTSPGRAATAPRKADEPGGLFGER
jgi:exodeoxyribonuclease VII large subunit